MTKQVEEWRPVVGYEGLYEVSNFGNVRSIDRYVLTKGGGIRICYGTLIQQRLDKDGYPSITLHKDGKQNGVNVHRLVALAFITIPEYLKHIPSNKLQVNHKDENKENNCAKNLEWCDARYNNNYGTRNEKVSQKLKNNERSKKVYQYSKDLILIKEYPSVSEITRVNNFKRASITKCCNGKCTNAYGFIWSFNKLN